MGTSADDALQNIEAALQEGDYEQAVNLAAKAARRFPTDPDVQAAYGEALWSMDDVEAARAAFETAVQLAPQSGMLWADLANVRLALTEFEAAGEAATRSMTLEVNADALEILCRLAERDGDLKKADALARRAQKLDPEEFPLPHRVSEAEFHSLVAQAAAEIPEQFQNALAGEVALLLAPVPPLEVLRSESPPLDPLLLGLYEGVPLPERDGLSGRPALPDRIHLFQHNLEHVATSRDELIEQIRITVFHEVGHYFGFSDEELEERDFG